MHENFRWIKVLPNPATFMQRILVLKFFDNQSRWQNFSPGENFCIIYGICYPVFNILAPTKSSNIITVLTIQKADRDCTAFKYLLIVNN